MTALSDKSLAIAVLERALEDLKPARGSLDIAIAVINAEGLGGSERIGKADYALTTAERELRAEIHDLREYWASGEPERLAAMDDEVAL